MYPDTTAFMQEYAAVIKKLLEFLKPIINDTLPDQVVDVPTYVSNENITYLDTHDNGSTAPHYMTVAGDARTTYPPGTLIIMPIIEPRIRRRRNSKDYFALISHS